MRLPCNTTVTLADAWGLTPSERAGQWTKADDELAARLWLRGESLETIQAETGRSQPSICRRMEEIGMPRRVNSRERLVEGQDLILTLDGRRKRKA